MRRAPQGHDHARLHVQDTRSPRPPLAHPERHFLKRAQRPDGVQVAEQHQGLGRRCGPAQSGPSTGPRPTFVCCAGFCPHCALIHPSSRVTQRFTAARSSVGDSRPNQFGDHFEHLRLALGHRPGQVAVSFHQSFSSGGKPNTLVVRLMARSVCCIFDTVQLFLSYVVYGFATLASQEY